jgi:hypothetical protein
MVCLNSGCVSTENTLMPIPFIRFHPHSFPFGAVCFGFAATPKVVFFTPYGIGCVFLSAFWIATYYLLGAYIVNKLNTTNCTDMGNFMAFTPLIRKITLPGAVFSLFYPAFWHIKPVTTNNTGLICAIFFPVGRDVFGAFVPRHAILTPTSRGTVNLAFVPEKDTPAKLAIPCYTFHILYIHHCFCKVNIGFEIAKARIAAAKRNLQYELFDMEASWSTRKTHPAKSGTSTSTAP